MRVNLLFGFLGSGKTTLARRILMERPQGDDGPGKMAVIVNEFGDVGIDGSILEGEDVNMVELTSGCLCCTLKGSLLNAVEELRDKSGVQQVVIEATGVAQPEEMMETFSDPSITERFEIQPMVTVVDAPKYFKIQPMLGDFYTAQVKNADILVLNKTDLASAEDLEAVRAELAAMNPTADMFFTEQCDVDVVELLKSQPSRIMTEYEHQGYGPPSEMHDHDHEHNDEHVHDHDHDDHRHAPAQSFVLDSSAGASEAGLRAFFTDLPDNVWRAKGYMELDGQPRLIQYTMGQLEIAEAKPREHHHMVFIGPDMDRPAIEAAFNGLPRTG